MKKNDDFFVNNLSFFYVKKIIIKINNKYNKRIRC